MRPLRRGLACQLPSQPLFSRARLHVGRPRQIYLPQQNHLIHRTGGLLWIGRCPTRDPLAADHKKNPIASSRNHRSWRAEPRPLLGLLLHQRLSRRES
jgi:hypothetical protein